MPTLNSHALIVTPFSVREEDRSRRALETEQAHVPGCTRKEQMCLGARDPEAVLGNHLVAAGVCLLQPSTVVHLNSSDPIVARIKWLESRARQESGAAGAGAGQRCKAPQAAGLENCCGQRACTAVTWHAMGGHTGQRAERKTGTGGGCDRTRQTGLSRAIRDAVRAGRHAPDGRNGGQPARRRSRLDK